MIMYYQQMSTSLSDIGVEFYVNSFFPQDSLLNYTSTSRSEINSAYTGLTAASPVSATLLAVSSVGESSFQAKAGCGCTPIAATLTDANDDGTWKYSEDTADFTASTCSCPNVLFVVVLCCNKQSVIYPAAFIRIDMGSNDFVGTTSGAGITSYFSGGYYNVHDDSMAEKCRELYPRTYTTELMGGRFCVDGLIGPATGDFDNDATIDDDINTLSGPTNRVSGTLCYP